MNMSNSGIIDNLDRRILAALDWKARIPVTDIAKLVHSNKDVVSYRIKKLEQDGIIIRYYPILNLSRLGYHINRLNIEVEELTEVEEAKFVAFLSEKINSGLVFRMDNPFKYGVFIWTKSVYDMEQIIDRIKQHLGSKFVRYRYALMCTVRQYPRDALFGLRMHSKNCNIIQQKQVEHDELDISILKKLAQNARVSTVQIAQDLNVPQPTVSYRLKAMGKNGIILGYRADFNVRKLGYEDIAVEIYLSDTKNKNLLEKWADGNPNTTWLQKVVGEADIELEIEVKDRHELEKVLNELRTKFPFIRRMVHYPEDYWKITYLP
jgi:DNA-binding Lrp family transcriptional regulator